MLWFHSKRVEDHKASANPALLSDATKLNTISIQQLATKAPFGYVGPLQQDLLELTVHPSTTA